MLIRQYTTDTTLEKKWDVGFGNGGVIVFTLVAVNSHCKMSHFIFLFLSLFLLLFFLLSAYSGTSLSASLFSCFQSLFFF